MSLEKNFDMSHDLMGQSIMLLHLKVALKFNKFLEYLCGTNSITIIQNIISF